jgi:hypothetical protein
MTDTTVVREAPAPATEDDLLNSRTTLRLDEETHFRLKWTSIALKKTMQSCIREAVVEWLDRNRERVSHATRRATGQGNQ